MKRVAMLPSLLTVGNFACGVLAILFCFHAIRLSERADALQDALARTQGEEMLVYACLVIFIAMVFDVLDGRVARMTGSESHFGAELDSLADDCTFGVAPAILVTTLWIQVQPPSAKWWGQVMFCAVVYAACAILRLARYNVEVGSVDKNYFTGLPSPGAAGAVVSAVLFCHEGYLNPFWQWLLETVPVRDTTEIMQMQARVLGVYMLVIGVLMVSRLRFVHVANRFLSGRKRFTYLVATLFALFLLFHRPVEVLFLAFNGYVLVSLINNASRMMVAVQRWFHPRVEALRNRRQSARQEKRDRRENDTPGDSP